MIKIINLIKLNIKKNNSKKSNSNNINNKSYQNRNNNSNIDINDYKKNSIFKKLEIQKQITTQKKKAEKIYNFIYL